jgi:hypothetical protein
VGPPTRKKGIIPDHTKATGRANMPETSKSKDGLKELKTTQNAKVSQNIVFLLETSISVF